MLSRGSCATHDLALAPDGTCVSCRRATLARRAEEERRRWKRGLAVFWVSAVVGLVAALAWGVWSGRAAAEDPGVEQHTAR